MASALTVDCRKTFPGRFTAAAQLTLPLDPPRVLILFGPSGSGKTTLLRCLAGLEWPEEGRIQFGSTTWVDAASNIRLSPQARRIGYMPQDYALFPTHTVAGNIEYGLSDLPTEARRERVRELIDLLQLQGLEQAKPAQLSGGQQQRVALARAIARRPQLLLLDEPLSALDAPTRAKLRSELRMLLKQLAIPTVVVTHDWAEALTLGDIIAVMSAGQVLQVGSPQEVFSRPADAEVAKVVGVETVVQGRMVESFGGVATIEVGDKKLMALGGEELGPDVFVCIRAEDVVLERVGTGPTSARNHVTGIVKEISSLGPLVRVEIDCGFQLAAMVTRSALDELGLEPGVPIVAAVKAGAVHLVPRRDSE